MKHLSKNCSFPHALSLDSFKYFITGELTYKDSAICNLYEFRQTDNREKAENVMLQAEEALYDAVCTFKNITQKEFDEFIESLDNELYDNL